jgi:DNA-binding NarL/FixJ family response regulator
MRAHHPAHRYGTPSGIPGVTRVLIADDHPLFREALCGVVAQVFARFGWPFSNLQASMIDEVMQIADQDDELDAILLDLSLLGSQGLSQLVALRAKQPAVPLIVLSSIADPQTVHLCMTCGVAGFIPKSASRAAILGALQTVFDGGIHMPIFPGSAASPPVFSQFGRRAYDDEQECGPLSGRQVAVLDLVTDGKSNKQIAWELSISETTVKAHMTAILRKLGVSSRAQAIVLLQRQSMQDTTALVVYHA